MKNLRKVLALVLVVATLFSFASVAGAYTDDAAIAADYSEAVGVLSAIGILNGYEDGSFKPTATIDRDEMAKMIAVLANAGDDQVHTVYAGACNFADTKTNWAKSYIGYCAHTGIVAGRSETTFDPNGKVTGLETAKMLLVVLGFNAEKQGYVGSNWKVNVIRDAKNFGLLDNFAADFDATKAITREQAAQMFMNALFCPIVVGTISDGIIDVSNALYIPEGWTLIDALKNGYAVLYGNVLVSDKYLGEIFNGLGFEREEDCFGRPGTSWFYTDPVTKKVTSIGFFVDTPVKTYTTAAAVATDFKTQIASGDYSVVSYYSGIVGDFATIMGKTGNGVLTEVYVTSYGAGQYELRTVTIPTYIAKVANYNRLEKTFDLVNAEGTTIAAGLKSAAVANNNYVLFNLCASAKDAGVGVWDADQSVHSVKAVTPTVAKVTYGRNYADNINKSYFEAGEKYFYSCNYGRMYNGNETDSIMTGSVDNGKTYNIFVDNYGYVILTTDYKAGTATDYKYAVLTAATQKETGKTVGTDGEVKTNYEYSATVYPYDGVAGAVSAETVDGYAAMYTKLDEIGEKLSAGLLVKYDTISKSVEVATAANVGEKLGKNSWKITADGKQMYADNDTLFMIRTTNAATGAKTYTEVVGYKNLDKDYISGDDIKMQYFASGDWLKVVFIDALYTTEATQVMVLGAMQWSAFNNDIVAAYKNDYYAYRVLTQGVEGMLLSTVKLNANTLYNATTTYLGTYSVKDEATGKALPLYKTVEIAPGVAELASTPTIHKDSTGAMWININGTWNPLSADFRYLLIGKDVAGDAFTGYCEITDDVKAVLYADDYLANSDVYYYTSGGAVTLIYEIAK